MRMDIRDYLTKISLYYHALGSVNADGFLTSIEEWCHQQYPGEYRLRWQNHQLALTFDDAAEESWFWLVYS